MNSLSKLQQLKEFLDKKVEEYNTINFIKSDPISVPHRFQKKQDIEISGFFASIFAWGNRTIIINKSALLMELMDNSPHDFIINHNEKDLKRFFGYKHRTFNVTDLLYFIFFLRYHYANNSSLESAFSKWMESTDETIENGLTGFHQYFFNLPDAPLRTKKHIATPERGSTCKRLNMFLRWMVRKDNCGVDFGIWKTIKPDQLICPIDVHVGRVAKKFGLIRRNSIDWLTSLELTSNLKKMDVKDPVKYDFALFGLGVAEHF
jgi:TIGR02757 family protein